MQRLSNEYDSKVYTACRRNVVESLIAIVIPEAAQAFRCRTGGLAVFLRHSDTSSLRIRMPSLALEFNSCADKDTWVAKAEGNENNLSRQGLYAVADSC